MMFTQKIVAGFRKPFGLAQGREKQSMARLDIVSEQVKKVLSASDQKLILMVRS